MSPTRRLRHWKQRYDANAKFIWRKSVFFQGEMTQPGSDVPAILTGNPNKLRRFWESGVIELKDFEAPDVATGQKPQEVEQPKVKEESISAKEEKKIPLSERFPKAKKAEAPAESWDDYVVKPTDKPEALVYKQENRKWRVKGSPVILPTRIAALDWATDAIVEANN